MGMKTRFLKIFVCVVMFAVAGGLGVRAQEQMPVKVVLKNGHQINGYVNQDLDSDYVTITTKDGDTYVYNNEEIKKVKRTSSNVRRGFEHGVYSNFAIASGSYGNPGMTWIPTYLAGYRFNDYFFLGGGVGLGLICRWGEYGQGKTIGIMGDIFANIKVNFTKNQKVSPFFTASIGFPSVMKLALGVNFKINDKLSMDMGVGCAPTNEVLDDPTTITVDLGILF